MTTVSLCYTPVFPIRVRNACLGDAFPDQLKIALFRSGDFWEAVPIVSSVLVAKGCEAVLRPALDEEGPRRTSDPVRGEDEPGSNGAGGRERGRRARVGAAGATSSQGYGAMGSCRADEESRRAYTTPQATIANTLKLKIFRPGLLDEPLLTVTGVVRGDSLMLLASPMTGEITAQKM